MEGSGDRDGNGEGEEDSVLSFSEDPKVVWIGRPMDESGLGPQRPEGGTFFSEEWERAVASLSLF